MVDSKENYKFDLGVKGLICSFHILTSSVIYNSTDPW